MNHSETYAFSLLFEFMTQNGYNIYFINDFYRAFFACYFR